MKEPPSRPRKPVYKDVFAWFPVRLYHPAYRSPTGKWAWLRRIRRITVRRRSLHIEIPQE